MATCNLCPPGDRDVPDAEMADHLRTSHPEVDADGTRRGDGSTIVRDSSEAAAPDSPASDGLEPAGEWRS